MNAVPPTTLRMIWRSRPFARNYTALSWSAAFAPELCSALFQGYAFARFDREHDDWGRINAIDGVLGIYRHENVPVARP